jgi:hypothetical protein
MKCGGPPFCLNSQLRFPQSWRAFDPITEGIGFPSNVSGRRDQNAMRVDG